MELNQEEAARFLREVIVPIADTNKFGNWFVRNVDKVDIDHPEEAVMSMPVFEIFPVEDQAGVNG